MASNQVLPFIHVRDEGEIIENGFNFYPRDSLSSRGFVLKIGNTYFQVRYSKPQGRWLFGVRRNHGN